MTLDEFKKSKGLGGDTTSTASTPAAPVVGNTVKKSMSLDEFKAAKGIVQPSTEPKDPREEMQTPIIKPEGVWGQLLNAAPAIKYGLPVAKAIGNAAATVGKEIAKTFVAKPIVSLSAGITGDMKPVDVPLLGKTEPYFNPDLTPEQQFMSTSGDVLNAASVLPLGAAARTGAAAIEAEAPKIAEALAKSGVSKSVVEKMLNFFQSAPEKIGTAISGGIKSSAYKDMQAALGATTKEMRNISERISKEMVDRGVVAFTRKGLLSKAEQAAETAGKQIEKTIETMPQVEHPIKSIVSRLEEARDKFFDVTPKGKKVAIEPDKIKNYDELIKTIKKYGNKISDNSLIKIRRIWDETVARAKGYAGKTLAEGSAVNARREATTAIRQILASAHPELAKVNAEFSFWKNVEKVVGATVEKSMNKAPSMSEQVITGVGAAGGLAKGAPLVGAAAAKGAFRLVKSAAWKTMSAAVKNKIADAIVSGDIKYINSLILKFLGSKAEEAVDD